jgi:hypothetical protein
MNWISFLTYLGIGYATYYLLMILLDSMTASRNSPKDTLPVLTFTETVEPEKISMEDFSDNTFHAEPASIGLGSVSLKDLFTLAHQDAIEYTKSVSF